MRCLPTNRIFLLLSIWTAVACSSSDAPNTTGSLAPTYHLKSVDGVSLPIPSPGGGSLDSGHVRRLGGDTVLVDHYNHGPRASVVASGTWAATQVGNMVVLFPIVASSVDTAFLGAGDTLTLHTRQGGPLHVEVYVAP